MDLFPSAVRELASRTLSKFTRQGAVGVGGARGLEHPNEHCSICSRRELSVLRTAVGGWLWFTATEQRQAALREADRMGHKEWMSEGCSPLDKSRYLWPHDFIIWKRGVI